MNLSSVLVLLISLVDLWSAPADAFLYVSTYYRNYYYRIRYNQSPTYRRYRYSTMRRLARYSRVYPYNSLGNAYYYQSMYFYVSRMNGFRIKTTHYSYRDCGNFAANPYGDFIGYFSCPMFFEPMNFTYCCGKTNYNYCCSDQSKRSSTSSNDDDVPNSMIIGISVGVVMIAMGIGIFVLIMFCCCCSKTSGTRGRIRPWGRTTVMTTNTSHTGGIAVIQTAPQQQQWAYQNPGFAPPAYSAQPPVYPSQPPAYPAQQPAYPTQPMAVGYSAQPVPGIYPPQYQPPGSFPPADPAYPPPDPNGQTK